MYVSYNFVSCSSLHPITPSWIWDEVFEDFVSNEEFGEWEVEIPVGVSKEQMEEYLHLLLSREFGLPEPILYSGDKSPGLYTQEDLGDRHIELMDCVHELGLVRDRMPAQIKWEKLRYARSAWWSMFNEQLELVQLPYIIAREELDRHLAVLNSQGSSLSEDQWVFHLNTLSHIWGECEKGYLTKNGEYKPDYKGLQGKTRTVQLNHLIYPVLEKALAATKRCKDFWESDEGQELSEVNMGLTGYWKELNKLPNRWGEYWLLRDHVHNRWMISGTGSDAVDNPHQQEFRSVMDLIEAGSDGSQPVERRLHFQMEQGTVSSDEIKAILAKDGIYSRPAQTGNLGEYWDSLTQRIIEDSTNIWTKDQIKELEQRRNAPGIEYTNQAIDYCEAYNIQLEPEIKFFRLKKGESVVEFDPEVGRARHNGNDWVAMEIEKLRQAYKVCLKKGYVRA